MTTRQVKRAEARRAAKVELSEHSGRKYPETKYRPIEPTGKKYAANGKREVARRRAA